MKAKYLLTALALPALFAACSQEDIVTDANLPQSSELLGKVAGDVVFTFDTESRLAWGATDTPAWETNDEFSLFWVDDDFTAATDDTIPLKGAANALYKKDGSTFTSENILYVGKHLMVYPVDKTHLGNQEIVVKVDSIQDGSIVLGKRSVWVNDSLLNIKAPLKDPSKQKADTIYAAGYKNPVKAAVKPLSSNLVLNLNFDMPSTISEVTIKSVSLVADTQIFPANGQLSAKNDSVGFIAGDLAKEVKLNMPANTKITKDANTYTAQISLLPITTTATKYQIKVATNYGIVTIDSAKYVKSKDNTIYLCAASVNQKAEGFKIGNTALNLAPEFALTNENGAKYTYRGTDVKPTKAQESFGKRITANVTVKMSEASITNMEVANSTELIDAYATYTLLGKTKAESFIMKNTKPFELTPAAVSTILGNTKVTLTQVGNDTIKLTGAHTAIPVFTVAEGQTTKTLFNTTDKKLILGAEGTWNLDVDVAPAANKWVEIINAGTLTLKETNPMKNNVEVTDDNLTTPLTNMGKVEFSGNVSIPVAYTQKTSGQTVVAEGVTVNLTAATDFQKGSIDVDGKLITYSGTTQIQKDVTVAVAGALLANNTATLNNAGTITLEGAGRTIITNNKIGTNNGSIVCATRTSSVNVSGTEQGFIKWTCDVDKYKTDARDAFNYLILSKNVTMDDDVTNIKNIEINGTAVEVVNTTAANVSLDNVFVNAGKTMIVPTGSTVTTTAVDLKGDIEVYGTFTYTSKTGTGKIYDYSAQP